MPALGNSSVTTCILRVVFVLSIVFSGIFTSLSGGQTGLNDIHITPREGPPAPSLKLLNGSTLHVIKTDVNLVLVPVSVTDGSQRLVKGLSRENFEVFEGNSSQEIREFSSEDAPVSVGIIVDASGSMTDKADRVREAVHAFCEASNLEDEFFLIEFSDEPHLLTDFTDAENIEKELLFMRPKGRTALLDAIYLGLRTMKQARYEKKALLIISDGGDNHSRYGDKEVKSAAKEADVMIYSIGTFDRYVPTMEEVRGPDLLSEIAEPTGGRGFVLENVSEMPAVAHHIGTELRTQYVLAYRPKNSPKDGKWHRIKVKLRLPRKLAYLRARSKTGYYAREE